MREEKIQLQGQDVTVYALNTVVVGTGAAGFNAADCLYTYGQKDIAIVTEGLNMGTSRNTGSDKQTYYKLTLSGDTQDSVVEMAKTLFAGGCMDGDIALVEAALSPKAFYRLVDIGVPFPHNRYGEYIGYKTDHDPRQRATSVGPLTSKMMTEKLQEQVVGKGIPIFDGYQIIGILTDEHKQKAMGLLTLRLDCLEDAANRYVLFNCTNIVYATGGPAGIYATSVYPESQTGASGLAFEAGVLGKNLSESQYGIASIKFRWNLSGTYQQVLPRYVSTLPDGSDEKEFLEDYFKEPGKMLDAIFLKGYQWPFDPRKVENFGSSLIDILVYHETMIRGRRVFMDFMRNPSWGSLEGDLDFNLLGEESHTYLKNSNVLFGTPIMRLQHMNQPAIDLYLDHGIDLAKEYLEIAVCAQHNNGGLSGNLWWESNVSHFFPVGEVNGTHGVYRPGGSALNSGQVGSARAARYIASRYREEPLDTQAFKVIVEEQVHEKMEMGNKFLSNKGRSNVLSIRQQIGRSMSEVGAHIRGKEKVLQALSEAQKMLSSIAETTCMDAPQEMPFAFQNRDLLITQIVYLSAILNYIEKGGKSRGSYLVQDAQGILPVPGLPEDFRFSLMEEGAISKQIHETTYAKGNCQFHWRPVRPIPSEDDWFENIWNAFMRDEVIR